METLNISICYISILDIHSQLFGILVCNGVRAGQACVYPTVTNHYKMLPIIEIKKTQYEFVQVAKQVRTVPVRGCDAEKGLVLGSVIWEYILIGNHVIFSFVYIYIYVYYLFILNTKRYMWKRSFIYTYIYISIYTYTYTYIYIYIHLY